MTSDDTATGIAVHDEDTQTIEWVASLKDDGPETTSELVLVPGYTQSAWDRRQVRILNLADDGDAYLWANLGKPDDLLVYDLLLLINRPRAARAFMAGALVDPVTQVYVHPGEGLPPVHVVLEGAVRYAEVSPAPKPAKPAAKPKTPPRAGRRRPSQARKTVTGGTS